MKSLELVFPAKTSSYQICIGKELLSNQQLFFEVIQSPQVLIISNQVVAKLYLEKLKQTLQPLELYQFIIPDGEQFKSFEQYQKICTFMIENGLRRNTTLIALGGGVVGDLTGYVAATYYRGVPFIQVPTTLLSQVDSSVGGKTAINHPLGKNLIGAFHQPVRVIADLTTLKTLPQREYLCGIAEIIKAAIIFDEQFFEWLHQNHQPILAQDEGTISKMIERSCQIKADIVAQDEKEMGCRAWLNLGHTFGHGIERAMGYGELLHGEAVAIGVVLAAKFSLQQKQISNSDAQSIIGLLEKFGLPIELPINLNTNNMVSAMKLDKKNLNQNLTLVLPTKIGQVTIDNNISAEKVESFLRKQK